MPAPARARRTPVRRPSLLLALALVAGATALAAQPQAETPSQATPRLELPARPLWLVLGGGYDPLSNQISIYQDLTQARELFAGDGVTLFAGGAFAPLAVLDQPTRSDVHHLVARLLGDPDTAWTRFQTPAWRADGPATVEHVTDVLGRALAAKGDEPLLVYAAGHGEQGELAADNSLSLWGGWTLTVADLAEVLDRRSSRRSARFVVTSCYGGGFAELIFRAAEPTAGPRETVHCGLFAAPWDDEAAGCDPDPDRSAREAYGPHFLAALAGESRDGDPLAAADIDFDGDGRIGLLEAHTRVRIASRSIDVPTTTSERWLEQASGRGAVSARPPPDDFLPEELAVVTSLGRTLGLANPGQADERLADLEDRMYELADRADQLDAASDDAWWALRITLLERWPELEQPWLPDYARLLDREGQVIVAVATASPQARAYEKARLAAEEAAARYDDLRRERALVMRWMRAWQTRERASALAAAGGPAWATWQALRRCESWAPPLKR